MNEITQKNTSLQKILTHHINQYLADMKKQNITDMHHMMIEQIKQPLFQAVMVLVLLPAIKLLMNLKANQSNE